MTDMQSRMVCSWGRYYITCRDEYKGIYIEAIEGYNIRLFGAYYGLTRGKDGMYIITDCYTGTRIIDTQLDQKYSLVAAYRALKKYISDNMAMIEKLRSSRVHREAASMIREAYRRDLAKATGGKTNVDA